MSLLVQHAVNLEVQPRRRLEPQALAHLAAHEPSRTLQAYAYFLQRLFVGAVHGEEDARLAQIAADAHVGDGNEARVAHPRVFDHAAHHHVPENLPDLTRHPFRALTHPIPSIPDRCLPGVG